MNEHSFCIDKSILGTKKHFVCKRGMYLWCNEVPSYAWYLTGNVKNDCDLCLDTLAKLNGIEFNTSPPEKFVVALETVLSGSNIKPPWQYVMPKEAHKSFSKTLVEKVVETLSNASQDTYRTVWVPGNRVMRSLKRPKINASRYKELVDANVGNITSVKTFKPQQGGYADDVEYNRFGSVTGRLTVSSGPAILTLKKDYRNIITSRYGKQGKILYVDFSNLEPRILLYETGKRCANPDLYSELNNTLFSGDPKDRDLVKGAVISQLYGISKFALQARLQVSMKAIEDFTHKIQEHFKTKDLLKRIKDEFVKNGCITTRYGRKVKIDKPMNHIFINYYAQATGVDITMLGFDQLIQRSEDRKVVPLFTLSDALLLDVHEDDEAFVKLWHSVKVPGYVQTFPLSVEEI